MKSNEYNKNELFIHKRRERNVNERIKSIADEATYLFLQQGYSKTQISHIAKAVGVSVGTIYLDFTGKKEIRTEPRMDGKRIRL